VFGIVPLASVSARVWRYWTVAQLVLRCKLVLGSPHIFINFPLFTVWRYLTVTQLALRCKLVLGSPPPSTFPSPSFRSRDKATTSTMPSHRAAPRNPTLEVARWANGAFFPHTGSQGSSAYLYLSRRTSSLVCLPPPHLARSWESQTLYYGPL